MRRQIISLLVVLPAAIAAMSCSVKEDRSACPCYLTLNFDELSNAGECGDGLVTISSDGIISQEQISVQDYFGSGYESVVPRRHVTASCVAGLAEEKWDADILYVPDGIQWGRIMLASEGLDCKEDEYVVPMHFNKEYCTVTVEIIGISENNTPFWTVRLSASSCGIRMDDRFPVSGPYSVIASRQGEGTVYSVRVPRQSDFDMSLDLSAKDGTSFCLDIGRLVQDQGYDWTRPDLDDIYVVVDYARAVASVDIRKWNVNDVDESI